MFKNMFMRDYVSETDQSQHALWSCVALYHGLAGSPPGLDGVGKT